MAEKPTPKSEALEALTAARKMLDSRELLTPIRMVMLRGLLEYTEERVVAIAELKRMRRETPADPVQESLT